MHIVDQLYTWTDYVLYYGLVALRVWALIDCVTRKAAAFPAVDKLSKLAWLGILLVAGLLGSLPPLSSPDTPGAAASVFSIISTVVAAVYLADVRPAVREISGGK